MLRVFTAMMAQLVSWTEPAFHFVSTPGTGGTSVPFMPCGKPFGTTGILPWPSPPPGRLGTTPDEMPHGFVTGEWPGAIHG